MKVLFVLTPAFNPNDGGVQRTTWKLGKHFSENGLDVYYFSFENSGHVHAEYGTLFYANEDGNTGNKKNLDQLSNLLDHISMDIVINQMPYEVDLRKMLNQKKIELDFHLLACLRNTLFSFKNNARYRIREIPFKPLAILLDNSLGEAFVQWRHRVKHALELRSIISLHDYFILLSPPNKEELKHFIGEYKKHKVLCIPNSIPFVLDQVPSKEKMVLHVGRLNFEQKRSDLLLKFWERCYKLMPDWKFIIVGDGPFESRLKREIEEKRLPRVEWAGYQSPESFYEKASIFMMPSAFEGFPNTMLESQSYACASLAFNSYRAINWIVNDGVDALLSKPYDVDQMAKDAIELSSSEEKLLELQKMALLNASNFTIDRVGSMWLKIFEELKSGEPVNSPL